VVDDREQRQVAGTADRAEKAAKFVLGEVPRQVRQENEAGGHGGMATMRLAGRTAPFSGKAQSGGSARVAAGSRVIADSGDARSWSAGQERNRGMAVPLAIPGGGEPGVRASAEGRNRLSSI
jgi:hypothetical protein